MWVKKSAEEQEKATKQMQAIVLAYEIFTCKKVAEPDPLELIEHLFGSHLSPGGSKRVLYLFSALKGGMLQQEKCFLLKKKAKYVSNINHK